MLSRKNQVTKKVYKALIFPYPYEVMIEAVDKVTAKQEAVGRLEIKANDIYKITASTQASKALRACSCANERLATRRLIEKGYI